MNNRLKELIEKAKRLTDFTDRIIKEDAGLLRKLRDNNESVDNKGVTK